MRHMLGKDKNITLLVLRFKMTEMQAKSFKIKMKQTPVDDCELGVSIQIKIINLTPAKISSVYRGIWFGY